MAKKQNITCCNCGKQDTPNYGYKLCFSCHKKFKNGIIEHPLGENYRARYAGYNSAAPPPKSTLSPDSSLSLLSDHNYFALPDGVKLFKADPDGEVLACENIAA
ncbi:MAG: hypothetical protein MI749_02905 [Desulfovibrionales bacterium]|nr:hypothetical protein [Desulfovibrionales bacterium]